MSHAGTEDKLLPYLFPPNLDGLKILDLGHGLGQTGLMLRGLGVTRGQPELTGVDVYKPYHLLQERLGIYDKVILHDLCETPLPFKNKTHHITIVQQVIEHLPKEKGTKLLMELERVTKDLIIIATPNGYHESGPGTHGNQHSEHLSGWTAEDFHRLGYKTQIVSKNVNSRALQAFARLWFKLQCKTWENEMILSWKKPSS